MPLVALLEGHPVLALDPNVMRATCRDPKCGAEVHRRAGQGMVPHWVHNPGTADRCEASHEVGPWHVAWQMTCIDPARIEVAQGRRRADVLSRFGWAVEFQHSNMRGDKVRAREDDWKGALIWVQDASTEAAGSIVVRGEPDHLLTDFAKVQIDWLSPPSRISQARCHQIADLGDGRLLWLSGRIYKRSGDLLNVEAWLLPKQMFIDSWVNGQAIYPPGWKQSRWSWEQSKPGREIKPPQPRAARLVTALADASKGEEYACPKAGEIPSPQVQIAARPMPRPPRGCGQAGPDGGYCGKEPTVLYPRGRVCAEHVAALGLVA